MKRRERQANQKAGTVFSAVLTEKVATSLWWDENEAENDAPIKNDSPLEKYMQLSWAHHLSPSDIKVLNQQLKEIRRQFARVVRSKDEEIERWKQQARSFEEERDQVAGELEMWKEEFRNVLLALKQQRLQEDEEETEIKEPEADHVSEVIQRKKLIEEHLGRKADRVTYEQDLMEVILQLREANEVLEKTDSEKKILSMEIDHLASQLKQVTVEKNAIGKELGVQFFRLNMLRKEAEHINKIPSTKRNTIHRPSPRNVNSGHSTRTVGIRRGGGHISSERREFSELLGRNPMQSHSADLEKLDRLVSDAKIAHGMQTLQQAKMIKKIMQRNIHDLFGDVRDYLMMVRNTFGPSIKDEQDIESNMSSIDNMRQYLIRKIKGSTDAVLSLQEQLQEAKVYAEEHIQLGAWSRGDNYAHLQTLPNNNDSLDTCSAKAFEKRFPPLVNGRKPWWKAKKDRASDSSIISQSSGSEEGFTKRTEFFLERLDRGVWSYEENIPEEEFVHDFEFEWDAEAFILAKGRGLN